MHYDKLPSDPVILLSFVNTQLRDHYESLSAFCDDFELCADDIAAKLKTIDYEYDAPSNQFV